MSNRLVKVCGTLLAGISLTCGYTISGAVEEELQSVVDSFLTARPDITCGFSVAVKTADDEWSFATGAKRYDTPEDQITTETPFLIFSITKTVVGAYAMDMVRRGDLRLYDRIGDYYDFESRNPHISNDVTIEELLTHRSGIGQFPPYRPAGAWDPYDYIDLIPAPDFEPGTSFNYSGSNTTILAIIMQMVTGEDLNVLLKRRFFDRHNIRAALLPQDPVLPDHAALNAPLSFLDPSLPTDMTVFNDAVPMEAYGAAIWAEGGLMSVPKDIAKFGYSLLSGEDNGFRWMGQKMIPSIDSANVFPDWGWQMGYHLATVPQIVEENYGFHGYGWGTASSMYYLPSSESCIAIFVNQVDSEHMTHQYWVHFPLTNRLNEILVRHRESLSGETVERNETSLFEAVVSKPAE